MASARSIALDTLNFFESFGFVPFKKVSFALSTLSREDRAFGFNLICETFRKRVRLDYELSRYLKNPAGLPEPVYNALRLGALELLFLDSVPDYAAIDSTVELLGVREFKNLANAILRKVARNGLDEGAPYNVLHSHPAWLLDYWGQIEYLAPLEPLLIYNQTPPEVTVQQERREELLEEGYLFRESDFSKLLVLIQTGRPLEDLEKLDEIEHLLARTGLPVINHRGSLTGRLNGSPWLFHMISPESIAQSGLQARWKLEAESLDREEFIYYSRALTLEENGRAVGALEGYSPLRLEDFFERTNIQGRFDGAGYWLVPEKSPLAGYVCRLGRV